jgi:hypothetical protein
MLQWEKKKVRPMRETDYQQVLKHLPERQVCWGSTEHIVPFIQQHAPDTVCQRHLQNRVSIYIKSKGYQFVFQTDLPSRLQYELQQCSSRFIILTLWLERADQKDAHVNLLVLEQAPEGWTIERFEPHGILDVWEKERLHFLIDDELERIFRSMGVQCYVRPEAFLEKKGPQLKWDTHPSILGRNCDPNEVGFCATWCTLYGHIRTTEPHRTRQDVVRELHQLAKIPYFFRKYVACIEHTIQIKS